MKKSELKAGMKVIFRDGDCCYVVKNFFEMTDMFYAFKGSPEKDTSISLYCYNEDLSCTNREISYLDVVKIIDLNGVYHESEYIKNNKSKKERIEDQKKFLTALRLLGFNYISKSDHDTVFACFEDSHFKSIFEGNKRYTLSEEQKKLFYESDSRIEHLLGLKRFVTVSYLIEILETDHGGTD